VIERLPERARTPAVARAVTSPSGLLLAGAGMSVAILGGAPLVAAAAVGLACWAGRVALAIPRRKAAEEVSLSGLADPWRGYVQDAMLARSRFQQAVRQTPLGPLHDRLGEVSERLGDGVTEAWRVARRGQDLQMAMASLDVTRIRHELAECQAEARTGPGGARSPALERTVEALESQLASAQRIGSVQADARQRLRLLNAQLDEAVAEAVELSVKGSDLADVGRLTSSVEATVGELQALRQGLEEMGPPEAPAEA